MILTNEIPPNVHDKCKGGGSVIKCPFCNQVMDDDTPHNSSTDLFRCGACQAQQAIYWEHGERLLSFEPDRDK